MGVDEVACFIDFGVDTDSVIESLTYLNQLKESSKTSSNESPTLEIQDKPAPVATRGAAAGAEVWQTSVDERIKLQRSARQRSIHRLHR
jgi:hypothetical protein